MKRILLTLPSEYKIYLGWWLLWISKYACHVNKLNTSLITHTHVPLTWYALARLSHFDLVVVCLLVSVTKDIESGQTTAMFPLSLLSINHDANTPISESKTSTDNGIWNGKSSAVQRMLAMYHQEVIGYSLVAFSQYKKQKFHELNWFGVGGVALFLVVWW